MLFLDIHLIDRKLNLALVSECLLAQFEHKPKINVSINDEFILMEIGWKIYKMSFGSCNHAVIICNIVDFNFKCVSFRN